MSTKKAAKKAAKKVATPVAEVVTPPAVDAPAIPVEPTPAEIAAEIVTRIPEVIEAKEPVEVLTTTEKSGENLFVSQQARTFIKRTHAQIFGKEIKDSAFAEIVDKLEAGEQVFFEHSKQKFDINKAIRRRHNYGSVTNKE